MTKEDKVIEELREIKKAIKDEDVPMSKSLYKNFLRGLFTALGATVGMSIFLTLLTFLLSGLKIIPGVDDILRTIKVDSYLK